MLRPLLIVAITLLLAHSLHAHPPTGIVVDKQGTVYFTDLETVWKINSAGTLSVFRAGVSGRHVHELAIDKDGNLFGADLSYESEKWISSVWKMTPQGQLTYLVQPTSNPPRGANLFHDSAGNMYLADVDNRTKKQSVLLNRTPDGQVSVLAGGSYGYKDGKGTEAMFSSLGGIFVADDSSIYLTDATYLRRVLSDGVVTTIASNLHKRTLEDRPMLFGKNDGMLTGLTVDPKGNVYVADAGNQRLLKVSSDGTFVVVYRGEEPYYPNGVTVDSSGTLYVLEAGFIAPSTNLKPRVRKITPNGESSIVAVSGEMSSGNSGGGGHAEVRKWMVPIYLLGLIGVALVGLTLGIWQLTRHRRSKQFD